MVLIPAEIAAKLTCKVCGGLTDRHMPSFGCRNCFMIWYDSGIETAEELGAESRWRRENGWWPWGKNLGPTREQLNHWQSARAEVELSKENRK